MFTLNNQSSYNVVNNLMRLGAELAISNQRLSTGQRAARTILPGWWR